MYMPVSQAKLRPPQRSREHLTRQRLLDRLNRGVRKKATFVIAGAGYGKSSLLAEWSESLPSYVWHSLDNVDRDPGVFLSHLIAGLRTIWPDFGYAAQTVIERPTTPEPAVSMLAILSELEEYLVALPSGERFVLVLDDYHCLQDAAGTNAAMMLLLQRLPANMHCVLSSRVSPPINTTRVELSGQVNWLNSRDLRFNSAEIAALLGPFQLPHNAIRRLSDLTEGWPAAIQLWCQSLRQNPQHDFQSAPAILAPDLNTAYRHLAEEIIANQPPSLQQFLLQTAILKTLSPADCDILFARNDSAHWLAHLVQQDLFTIQLQHNPDIYRYHHLFWGFLHGKLEREYDKPVRREWQRAAAVHFQENQRWEEAFEHALEAGDESLAVEIAGQGFSPLRLSGRLDTIQNWLDAFTADAYDNHPFLHSLQGFIWTDHQLFDQAQGAYDQALARAETGNDPQRTLVSAWSGIGYLHQRTGNLEEALRAFETAVAHANVRGDARDRFTTLNGLAVTHSLLGQNRQCLELFHQVAELVTPFGKPLEALVMNNLGTVCTSLGEFSEALRWHRAALEIRTSLDLRPGLGHTYNNIGRAHWFLGELAEARTALEQSITLSKEVNNLSLQAYAYSNLGDVATAEGNTAQAYRHYQRAIELNDALNEPLGLVHTWTRLSHWARRQGRLDDANSYAERAFERAEAGVVGLNEQLAARTARALAQMAQGQIVFAHDELQQIVALHRDKTHDKYHLVEALWSLASIQHSMGRDPLESLSEAFALAERWQYHSLLQRLIRRQPELLVAAIDAGLHTSYVLSLTRSLDETITLALTLAFEQGNIGQRRRILAFLAESGLDVAWHLAKQAQQDADPSLQTAGAHTIEQLQRQTPPPLSVTTLGTFSLRCGNRSITQPDWVNLKAQTLFKILLLNAPAPVLREVLSDIVWPQATPRAAGRNLNQALSRLRRVLEPYLPRYASSRYVVTEGDAYRLLLPPGSAVDDRDFEALLRQGRQLERRGDTEGALACFDEAIALYGSDYLAQDLHEDWCYRRRDYLRQQVLATLETVVTLRLQKNELDGAKKAAERMLDVDHLYEEGYFHLMRVYEALALPAMALDTFRRCQEVMRSELDADPSPHIVELYGNIRGEI